MLKSIRIRRFKSLTDTGDLELKPLTLLVGPNSSGKSSLLQALLMLKQTLLSPDIESPIALSGPVTPLPSFPDLVSSGRLQEGLEVGLTSSLRWSARRNADVSFDLTVNYDARRQAVFMSKFTGSISGLPDWQGRTIAWEESRSPGNGGNLLLLQIGEIPGREFKFSLPARRGRAGWSGASWFASWWSAYRAHVDEFELDDHQIELLENAMGFLPDDIEDALRGELVRKLYYVGPLRDDPHRHYEVTGEVPSDVGKRGERAALILRRGGTILLSRVRRALERLGLALTLRLVRLTPQLYRVDLIDAHSGARVNVADVGFGTSQVLPIVVQGFFQPKGSILLLEQPEIHLHARAQAELGGLLVDIVRDGKQLIVETHSQHMISRIQRQIAEGMIPAEDVRIYYFDPGAKGTVIRTIELDGRGRLVRASLPKGFFEELYEEAAQLHRATRG